MKWYKKIWSLMPIILTSLLLSFFVWFSAVNSKDPTEEITYTRPIPIEILGQNPQYTISEQSAGNVTVTIKAPRSVHNALANDIKLIRATINISALQEGQVELEPDIQIDVKPARLVNYSPKTVRLNLEKLVTTTFPIKLNQTGNLSMGMEARKARLEYSEVQVTGPESKMAKVSEVLATVDMSTVTGNVNKQVALQAVDAQGTVIEGLTLSPSRIIVTIPILQKGGYKNAFLALIPIGSPAFGFQITHTEITPQVVTIYALDPNQTDSLPDLIQTEPINLNGRNESFEQEVGLNLPPGVKLAGDTKVIVKITIEPTITTKSIRGVPITLLNTPMGLEAVLNISTVDVYLTGPMNLLNELTAQNLTIALDLTNIRPGTHELQPTIVLPDESINYQIVPDTIEVHIRPK
jgi:YbbR domain-containing protein